MKKFVSVVLALLMVVAMFTACGSNSNDTATQPGNTATEPAKTDTQPAKTDAQPAKTDAQPAKTDAQPAASAEPKSLVCALSAEPQTLDPHATAFSSTNAGVQCCIFATLLGYDAGSYIPYVAESYEWTGDTELTLKIRKDVYSESGAHITAEDCLFSFLRAATNPSIGNTFTDFDVENCRTTDEYTLILATKVKNCTAQRALCLTPCAVISKSDLEAVGEEAFARNPVGTGPYKMVKWDAGTEIVLEKNPDFWGDPVVYDTLTFKFIPDSNSRSLALQSGDIDLAENLGASILPTLQGNSNIVIHQVDISETQMIWFNGTNEILSDSRVRYALEYATNKDAIVAAVFYGNGTPNDSNFCKSSKQYTESTSPRNYDPEKAKQLLAEAGYENGFDLELTCYESSDYQGILQMVQEQWRQVGVNCNIVVLDKGAYFNKVYDGDFDVYTIHNVGADPAGRINFYNSTLSRKGGNLMQYKNPEADRVKDLAKGEADENQRNEYWKQFSNILREDCPSFALCDTYQVAASKPGVSNVVTGPLSYIMYFKLQAE